MSINRIFIALAALLLTLSPNARAAAQSKLGAAKSIRCTFPTIATGSWKDGKPEAAVKPASLVLEFESINTDEGSAQLKGGYGTYDIIVRLAGTYWHFIQAFRDGKHEGKVKGRALQARVLPYGAAGIYLESGAVLWGMRDYELGAPHCSGAL